MSELAIKNAKHALQEHRQLKSCWSRESALSQRILIYCAELLEQITEQTRKSPRKKRPLSAWQKFLSVEMRKGVSVRDAAKKWRAARGILAA